MAQLAVVGDRPELLLRGVEATNPVRLDLLVPEARSGDEQHIVKALDEGIDCRTRILSGEPLLATIQAVQSVVQEVRGVYDDVMMNLGGADRGMACAGLSAAFVAGVKSFDIQADEVVFLPVLQFSYREVVSDAKLSILQALAKLGGECKSLRDLAKAAGIQDSLVSYHIRGGRDSRGLETLGLVHVHRGARGSLTIRLTPMGQLLANGLAR